MRTFMKYFRLVVILVIVAPLPTAVSRFEAASTDSVSRLSSPGKNAERGMSLAQWREEEEAAEEAMNAPRGEERIARCEAFVRDHPDYPQLGWVLRVLVDASIEARSYDPAKPRTTSSIHP
jgi:hypothetical protein